jgi:hypothetical protein
MMFYAGKSICMIQCERLDHVVVIGGKGHNYCITYTVA